MKSMLYISLLCFLAGCTSSQAYLNRWNDMWIDMVLRHKYEKYSCASCANRLHDYAKDAPQKVPRRRVEVSSQRPDEAEVRRLNARIDALELVLKTNATTTNQNQDLIVQQIRELKSKLEAIQK
jgi:uncharacterized coiled-coil DUF342 family protein